MGFRSTFTTEHYGIDWPQWFRDKYKSSIYFKEDGFGPLHSMFEARIYDIWLNLHTDIQKAIDWDKPPSKFVLVYLHDCGGITRCEISKDAIKWSEPKKWEQTDGVTHEYCKNCHDSSLM
jgi:hypothetical protein